MQTRRKLNYSLAIIVILIIIPIGISFFAHYKITSRARIIEKINHLSILFFRENYLINNYFHYLVDNNLQEKNKNLELDKTENEFLDNYSELSEEIEGLKYVFKGEEEKNSLDKTNQELIFLKDEFMKIKDIYVDNRIFSEKNDLLLTEIIDKENFIERELFSKEFKESMGTSTDYYKLFARFEEIKNYQDTLLYKAVDDGSLDKVLFLLAGFRDDIKKNEYFRDNSNLFIAFDLYQEKLSSFLNNKLNKNPNQLVIERELLKIDKRLNNFFRESSDSPLVLLRNSGYSQIDNIVLSSFVSVLFFVALLLLFSFIFFKKIINIFLIPLQEILDFSKKIGRDLEYKPLDVSSEDDLSPLKRSLNNIDNRLKESRKDLIKKVDELKVKDNIVSLVEALTDGVIMYNKEKEIVLRNSSVDRILNVAGKKISLKNLYSIFAKHNLEFHIDLSLRTKDIYRIDNVDLNSKTYEVIITQVDDHESNVVGGLIVFHKKEYNIEFKHENNKKIDFAPVISPHFGTPLSYIKLFTEMLSSGKIGQLNKEQRECILNIHQSAINMKELVDKLQDIAILNKDELKIETEEFNLAELLRELIEKYREKNNIDNFNFNFKELLPSDIKINIDRSIFSKVFFNILDNAVIYSESKSNKIDIELKELGFNYLLSIKDYGIGIVEEEQDFIFDKFFRAKNAMTKNTEGSGISLYIAKKLLTKVGVELFFESKVGEGTTFFIEIPKGGMRK